MKHAKTSTSKSGTTSGGCGHNGGGWKAVLGSNHEAIALYRIFLGIMLFIELASRFQYLHAFYSDEGCVFVSIC